MSKYSNIILTEFRWVNKNQWKPFDETHWRFVEEFIPNYSERQDINLAVDLSGTLNGNNKSRTITWFYDNYPEYIGFSRKRLVQVLDTINKKLFEEALNNFQNHLNNGSIQIRKSLTTTVSARLTGECDNDYIYLEIADTTHPQCGQVLHIPSANLQNVRARYIRQSSGNYKFQIYYKIWCNAQSIDFDIGADD